MSKTTQKLAALSSMQALDIKELGYNTLVDLLKKISVKRAGLYLHLNTPTIYRILDNALPIEAINRNTAVVIIISCLTDPRLVKILNAHPTEHAYYKHERHAVLAAKNGVEPTEKISPKDLQKAKTEDKKEQRRSNNRGKQA